MTLDDSLRVHQFLPESRANGPGRRAVLWVQGCTLGCPGCFNPATHPTAGGSEVEVAALLARLRSAEGQIEGLTVSGGEPFQQPRPLLRLLQRVQAETSLSVLVFTGFTLEEIERLPLGPALLETIDLLIAGRYDATRRVARGLLGSANKALHFLTPRYGPQDLETLPAAEVTITPGGEVLLSGIDPLIWEG